MSIEPFLSTYRIVVCDECGASSDYALESENPRTVAEDNGFAFSGGKDLCPQCRVDSCKRLVEAAPEMLEALEQARAAMPDRAFATEDAKHVIDMVNAAIAKAKGESE